MPDDSKRLEDKVKRLEDKVKQLEEDVRASRRETERMKALVAKSLHKAREIDKDTQALACKTLGVVNVLAGTDK